MKVYVNGERYEEVLVEIVVDQKSFYVPRHKLLMFPESYFSVALKPVWNVRYNGSETDEQEYRLIVNDRSSSLFRWIAMYLELGVIPRDKRGECLFDSRLLELLREEADYYCLSALVLELDELLKIKAAAVAKARLKMCDELCLTKGCVVGRDTQWFREGKEDMKYSDYFSDSLYVCSTGFCLAFYWICCCYNDYIVVDSINQSYSNDTHEYRDRDDSNFLPCFQKLEGRYGKAKLEVTKDFIKFVTPCIAGLSLAPYKNKLKLIQIQYLSPEGTWTIDDEEGVKKDEAIGYVIVQRKTYMCSGGKLLLNREDGFEFCRNSDYEQLFLFTGVDQHVIMPMTRGSQRVLVLAIVPGKSQYSDECVKMYRDIYRDIYHDNYCDSSRMPVDASYCAYFNNLFDYIGNGFIFGLYSQHYYSDTHELFNSFDQNTLKGHDKHLFTFARANNIPISLVYVRSDQDGNVTILESDKHTLVDCHKNITNVRFVPLFGGTVYKLNSNTYNARLYINRDQFIVSAFILGRPNAC